MKRLWIFVVLGSLLLAACGSAAVPDEGVPALTVTDGIGSKSYTLAALQKLGQAQAEEKGIIYLGVSLVDLLRNAGYDPETVFAVEAIASDGFTAAYDPILIQKSDTLLAYGRVNGSLSEEEGLLRMVLPGLAGKLNVRMVVKLKVTHP